MAEIVYGTPPGGGFQATVPGTGGFDFPGGEGTDFSWIADLAHRSALNKIRRQNLEMKMLEKEMYAPRLLKRPNTGAAALLGQETMASEIEKQRARRMAPPKKWIGGAGYGLGATIEAPELYSGIQREMFLPGSSTYEGPSLTEMDELGRMRSIADLQRMPLQDPMRWRASQDIIDRSQPDPRWYGRA